VNKGQTKTWSVIEVICNVVIGYIVALTAQLVVYPLLGILVTFSQNLQIGAIFTVIGIVRSYYVRRLFNWLHLRGAQT
jgi:hypothetical protein